MSDYVIKRGDNLTKIAKKYGTTVKELQKLNGLKGDLIIAGKSLKVPEGAETKLEHTEAKPEDVSTQAARNAAHTKEVERVKEMAKQSKEQTVKGAAKNNSSTATIKLIEDEMNRKGVPEGNSRYGSKEYWTNLIDKVSTEFDFPKEILIAKVSREVTFQKNKVAGDQHGCMQVRHTAVRAMFPKAPGNWSDKYKELDEKLYNDILYKKDSNTGEFLKDNNGNMIPKYSSWKELLKDCNNDEISIKVGMLYDKMQMAESVAARKYGSKNVYPHLSETIAELKAKTTIHPEENLRNIKGMETRYNGSPKYGKAITDSIQRMNIDLTKPIIVRRA